MFELYCVGWYIFICCFFVLPEILEKNSLEANLSSIFIWKVETSRIQEGDEKCCLWDNYQKHIISLCLAGMFKINL